MRDVIKEQRLSRKQKIKNITIAYTAAVKIGKHKLACDGMQPCVEIVTQTGIHVNRDSILLTQLCNFHNVINTSMRKLGSRPNQHAGRPGTKEMFFTSILVSSLPYPLLEAISFIRLLTLLLYHNVGYTPLCGGLLLSDIISLLVFVVILLSSAYLKSSVPSKGYTCS